MHGEGIETWSDNDECTTRTGKNTDLDSLPCLMEKSTSAIIAITKCIFMVNYSGPRVANFKENREKTKCMVLVSS